MRRAGAVALLLVVLGGCRSGGTGIRPGPGGSDPIVEATTRPATVSLRVTGAFTLQYDGPATLQIVVPSLKLDAALRLFSVALDKPVTVRNTNVRVGVNLFGYTGDGVATIPTAGASPAGGGLPSIAYVEVSPTTGSGTPVTFKHAAKTCRLETGLRGRSGRLECASLGTAAGDKTVSVSFTWTAQ